MPKSLYEIVGVSPLADSAVIAAAYRSLTEHLTARAKTGDDDAAKILTLVHTAYRVLSNPPQRALYDERLARSDDQEPRAGHSPGRQTMPFVAAKCPQCGGLLQVPSDRDSVKCMYCGVDVVVRQAIQLASGSTGNLLGLAKSAELASNYGEAYEYFTKTLESAPTSAEAWRGKGASAGWLSNLSQMRFPEMVIAFDNAIKFSDPNSAPKMRITCANAINEVMTAYHTLARRHVVEYASSNGTWQDYLDRCSAVIRMYEKAHTYAPEDQSIIRNVIRVCKDNIEGIKYVDSYKGNPSKYVHGVSDKYEKTLRQKLNEYAEKMRALVPSYVAPNPKPQSALCFVVTATMGDAEHPYVILLRSFRDELLVHTRQGRRFVAWYSANGPLLAERIDRSKVCRCLSYHFIVLPAVWIARAIMFFADQNSKV